MAQFKYNSSVTSAFTLPDGSDYRLFEGDTYELPEDNAHIQSLVAQGYLLPVEPKAKPKQPEKQNSEK